MTWTKEQQTEYNKQYYKNNKNMLITASARYKKKYKFINPRNYICAAARRRARKLGQEFSITFEDIVIPEFCPVLGIPLYFTSGKASPNSPSIDRVDNSKGYTKDNIAIISYLANNKKRDLSLEEINSLAKYINEHNKGKSD